MSPTVALTALLVVMAVELPDKTLIATVVLTTRYRPLPVLVGVSGAFFLQCLIAVTAGQLLTLLPHRVLAGVVAVLFGLGALLLLRGADAEEVPNRGSGRGWRRAATAFAVVFAAEWGDASQLATAALTARYDDPVAVFVGSFVALVGVAALAVALGNVLTRRVPLRLVQRVAAMIFLVFTVVATVEVVRG